MKDLSGLYIMSPDLMTAPQYDPRDEFGDPIPVDKMEIVNRVLDSMGATSQAIADALIAYEGPNREPSNAELAAATGKSEVVIRQTFSRWNRKADELRELKPDAERAPDTERFAPPERKQRSDKGRARENYNLSSLNNLKNNNHNDRYALNDLKDPYFDIPFDAIDDALAFTTLKEECRRADYPHSMPNCLTSFNPFPVYVIVDPAEEEARQAMNAAIREVENDEHRAILFAWRDGIDVKVIAKRFKKRESHVGRIIEKFAEKAPTTLPRERTKPIYPERAPESVVGQHKKYGHRILGVASAQPRAYSIHIAPRKGSTNYKETRLYGELREAAFENLAVS